MNWLIGLWTINWLVGQLFGWLPLAVSCTDLRPHQQLIWMILANAEQTQELRSKQWWHCRQKDELRGLVAFATTNDNVVNGT